MFRYALFLLLLGALLAPLVNATERKAVTRAWEHLEPRKLKLRSKAALVMDQFGNTLYSKDAEGPRPIASLTKLMTAIVILDSGLPLDEKITITKADRDLRRLTGSRLRYGATLSRQDMLTLAVMASENRAAAALGRTYPGGTEAFVEAMNAKARELGMHDSRFADPAGLDEANVASPADIARMALAASKFPLIGEASTRRTMEVRPWRRLGPLRFGNTNRLLRNKRWDISLSKTGYINEAGRCLVMMAEIEGTPMTLVFLDSYGKLTPFGDANRTRKWLARGVKRSLAASR